jgi:Rrf2 family protein
MLYLSMKETKAPVLQRDISAALNIPPHFLGKILQALVKNRLLVSQKGKNGGFVLSQPASQITPLNIVRAIDGHFFDDCVLGFPGCSDENPCPMHGDWQLVKARMLEFLQKASLEELGDKLGAKLDAIKEIRVPLYQ